MRTTDNIKQQIFSLEEVKGDLNLGCGNGILYQIKDKKGNVVCITGDKSYADSIIWHPELIQFTEMLRDTLKGKGSEKGMIYNTVNHFLNKILA